MTKEEILKKKRVNFQCFDSRIECHIKTVELAMEEYAKQESIAFAIFSSNYNFKILDVLCEKDFKIQSDELWNEYQKSKSKEEALGLLNFYRKFMKFKKDMGVENALISSDELWDAYQKSKVK